MTFLDFKSAATDTSPISTLSLFIYDLLKKLYNLIFTFVESKDLLLNNSQGLMRNKYTVSELFSLQFECLIVFLDLCTAEHSIGHVFTKGRSMFEGMT